MTSKKFSKIFKKGIEIFVFLSYNTISALKYESILARIPILFCGAVYGLGANFAGLYNKI